MVAAAEAGMWTPGLVSHSRSSCSKGSSRVARSIRGVEAPTPGGGGLSALENEEWGVEIGVGRDEVAGVGSWL